MGRSRVWLLLVGRGAANSHLPAPPFCLLSLSGSSTMKQSHVRGIDCLHRLLGFIFSHSAKPVFTHTSTFHTHKIWRHALCAVFSSSVSFVLVYALACYFSMEASILPGSLLEFQAQPRSTRTEFIRLARCPGDEHCTLKFRKH